MGTVRASEGDGGATPPLAVDRMNGSMGWSTFNRGSSWDNASSLGWCYCDWACSRGMMRTAVEISRRAG